MWRETEEAESIFTWCICESVPDINVCGFSLCKELHRKDLRLSTVFTRAGH